MAETKTHPPPAAKYFLSTLMSRQYMLEVNRALVSINEPSLSEYSFKSLESAATKKLSF